MVDVRVSELRIHKYTKITTKNKNKHKIANTTRIGLGRAGRGAPGPYATCWVHSGRGMQSELAQPSPAQPSPAVLK